MKALKIRIDIINGPLRDRINAWSIRRAADRAAEGSLDSFRINVRNEVHDDIYEEVGRI